MTTIHTRQLQQYTQDNCNNTHEATTKIDTRQLQQYTQDNYNNTVVISQYGDIKQRWICNLEGLKMTQKETEPVALKRHFMYELLCF